MSDNVTIARPYAKAIFNHACAHSALSAWSVVLQDLASTAVNPEAVRLLCNPECAATLHEELMLAVLDKSHHKLEITPIKNLLHLLVTNKRLLLLPDIATQFELLRAEHEKTLTVNIRCFASLSNEHQERLTESLSKRLQRHVILEMTIDPSLLGGAVIQAGDLVIDGSIRGKLTKLGTELAA